MKLSRYEASTRRSFYLALNELRRLRADRLITIERLARIGRAGSPVPISRLLDEFFAPPRRNYNSKPISHAPAAPAPPKCVRMPSGETPQPSPNPSIGGEDAPIS